MLGKVLALSTLSAYVILSAIMQSTSPSTIHPLGILLVFVVLYVLALGVLTFFIFWGSKLIRFVFSRTALAPLELKRAYFYSSVLALAPVMIIAMRSIGRTGIYEVLLVVLFEIIAFFYIAKHR